NQCTFSNDVYNRNPALPEAVEGGFYQLEGLNGPYVSDVVKTAVPLRNWVAITSGFDLRHLFYRDCMTTLGRKLWSYYMLNQVFGSICQLQSGFFTPGAGICADAPGDSRAALDFMKIGDAVMRHGISTVRLGIAQAGRVQVSIYDVAGRRVRVLADRVFPA